MVFGNATTEQIQQAKEKFFGGINAYLEKFPEDTYAKGFFNERYNEEGSRPIVEYLYFEIHGEYPSPNNRKLKNRDEFSWGDFWFNCSVCMILLLCAIIVVLIYRMLQQ